MAHPHAHIRHHEQRHAEEHVRRAGYKRGGDVEQDKKMVTAAVHEHERHDHPGKPLTALRLRGGGKVRGVEPKRRADRMARGGNVRNRGPAKVNIVIATGGGEAERQMAFRQGAQTGAAVAGSRPLMPPMGGAMPPRPPMPPMGGPPGGAMPMPPNAAMTGALPGTMPPRPPMKRGGMVEMAGAGGGEGRLEKAGMEDRIRVRAHSRRRGGRCE